MQHFLVLLKIDLTGKYIFGLGLISFYSSVEKFFFSVSFASADLSVLLDLESLDARKWPDPGPRTLAPLFLDLVYLWQVKAKIRKFLAWLRSWENFNALKWNQFTLTLYTLRRCQRCDLSGKDDQELLEDHPRTFNSFCF